MDQYNLWLDGKFAKTNDEFSFTNSTQTTLLLIAFCYEKININLVIPEKEYGKEMLTETINKKVDKGIKIPDFLFERVSICNESAQPQQVLNCGLPTLLTHNKQYVVSGLCHVLRYIVKGSTKNDANLMHLLGHKKCCLKASSEVSSRTNLCEILAPELIDNYLTTADKVFDQNLPVPIQELETLLNGPVVIHNMDKQQRIILERLTTTIDQPHPEKIQKLINPRKKKIVTLTNDLPQLQHVFVEGIEFMLSDIALFPCVHAFIEYYQQELHILSKLIPSTLTWYNTLKHTPEMSRAVKSCGREFINVEQFVNKKTFKMEKGGRQILDLGPSVNRKDLNISRKELEITIRRDLPSTLERILKQIQPRVEKFNPECIFLEWQKLPEDVHPTKGELNSARAKRKCHQIENLAAAVRLLCKDGDTVVDFCCGGGHVGIVLAYLLPMCHIALVENKEESLDRARARIEALQLTNITIYQCNLEHYKGEFNVGVALHACGVATDMVLNKCLQTSASFVLSPCCYGRVQNAHSISYPQSGCFKEIPLSFQELLLLGHAGDQTTWNFQSDKAKQGKLCMNLLDQDRISHAKEQGYKAHLLTMQPHHCTPKNNLIVGSKQLDTSFTDNLLLT